MIAHFRDASVMDRTVIWIEANTCRAAMENRVFIEFSLGFEFEGVDLATFVN